VAAKTETADPNTPAKPLSIFDRHSAKTNLMNRIMRALKDAPDDETRQALIDEVAAFNKFKPKES